MRELVASADRAISVGGPTLAIEAFRAGLIDDVRLRALAEPLRPSGYGTYLLRLLETDLAGPAYAMNVAADAP